jgi:hypothetical protein
LSPSAVQPLTLRNWFETPVRRPERSLDAVRIGAALLLAIHPLYTLLHPVELQRLTQLIADHTVRWNPSLTWAVCLLQLACPLALLANRLHLAATAGHLVVLAAGMGMTRFTHWYTVGGAAWPGSPRSCRRGRAGRGPRRRPRGRANAGGGPAPSPRRLTLRSWPARPPFKPEGIPERRRGPSLNGHSWALDGRARATLRRQ